MDIDVDVDVTVDLDQCTKATDAPAQTNKNTATTTTTPPASINRHYKYLTNSQLLNLQLQDPEIRIHFLTQFLIISSYLSFSISAHAAATATPSPSSSSTNASPTKNKNTTTTSTTVNNNVSTMCTSILDSLTHLEKRANMLLRQTPPNGELHVQTLHWILSERESIWRQWKKAKCTPSIERFATAAVADATVANSSTKSSTSLSLAGSARTVTSTTSRTKRSATAMVGELEPNGRADGKRARYLGSTSCPVDTKNTIETKANFYSFKIDIRKDLPTLSSNIAKKHTPNLHTYLETYVEALNPEAGIEEEYNPKNDKLFAWRALRLLARRHVGDFGRCSGGAGTGTMIRRKNGDFEGMVRTIWKDEKGIDIAGQMPEAEVISDDDEEEEKKEEVEENIDSKVGVVTGEDEKNGAAEMKDTVMGIPDNTNQLKIDDRLPASVCSNEESEDLFPPSPTGPEYFGPEEPKSETAAVPITVAADIIAEDNSPTTSKTASTKEDTVTTKQPPGPQHSSSTENNKRNTCDNKNLPVSIVRPKKETPESTVKVEKSSEIEPKPKPKPDASPTKVTIDKHDSRGSSNALSNKVNTDNHDSRGSSHNVPDLKRNSNKEPPQKEKTHRDVNGSKPKTHVDDKEQNNKSANQTVNHSSPTKDESSDKTKDNQNHGRENHSSRPSAEGVKRHDRDLNNRGRHNPSDGQVRAHQERRSPNGRGHSQPPRRPLSRGQMPYDARNDARVGAGGTGQWRPEVNGGQQHMGNRSGDHGGSRNRPFDRRNGGNNASVQGSSRLTQRRR